MDLFLVLLLKLLPIYAVMAAGYGLARVTGNITAGLAALQIYFITPLVVFTNISTLQPSWQLAVLPLTVLVLCVTISSLVYFATRSRADGPLLAQASGTSNMGYLGVPVMLSIFPETLLPAYLFAIVASPLCENSLGYYFLARGRFTPRDALRKLIKLPTIYALIAALIYGGLHCTFPESWQGIIRDLRGSYVILGSLIVGIGLGQIKKWEFDFTFLGLLMFIKFLVWPLMALMLLYLERHYLGVMQPQHAPLILLISLMPLAANTAAFAALVGVHPEKAATAVAASTVVSLVTLPLSAMLLGLI